MNYSVNLNITPGGMPPVLHMSQYDTGRTYAVTIKDADGGNASLGTNPTAKVKGFNGKNCFEIDATVANSVVTFSLTDAATDQYGIFPVTIELTVDGQDIISPLCMIFDVQKAGYTNEQAASSPEFENAMEAAILAYLEDHPAAGWSDEAKQLLIDILNMGVYTSPNAPTYIAALETALNPSVTLESITAEYDQDRPIYYNISTLDDVKLDLVVTANYSDGSSATVDNYTLSGDLNVGTDTITVTYGGKTDTISVVVTEKWSYSISDLTKVTGTLATEENATCKMLLSKSGSNNQYRRSFMMGRGATSVAVANSGTTITSQTSDYYPIKVPAGATKFTISITPSTQYLQVLARSLTDGVYSTLSTSSGWSGYQQAGGTKVFSDAVGDNGYIFVTSKYNSAGTSYPTEPTALDIVFSDE